MLDKFNITPFSILDTRSKDWQQRKRWWINKYNIQSELGREDTKSSVSLWNDNSVSIFDATLCEVIYNWFLPEGGGSILDPFAGGSVRGIVASELGHEYMGIDLNESQIEANKLQSTKPNWIHGDSNEALDTICDNQYDLVFTCPPYHDLEIYTDKDNDLSNMSYNDFLNAYSSIIQKSFSKLKDNRFFVIVVSEIRDLSKTSNYKIGKYKGFVNSTIQLAEESGYHFYNDLILINSTLNASRVSKTYFNRNRKIASVHQNVLVFVKGNPDIAVEEFKDTEPICIIDNTPYKSFRHAAISIDPDNLVASEVERRCKHPKFKYKDWNIVGDSKKPVIKIDIDGVLFESIGQASSVLKLLDEREILSRVNSRDPQWSHWKYTNINELTYDEVISTWSKTPKDANNTISCEGIEFKNSKDAGDYFELTPTRINQKIKSDQYPDYFRL